MADMIHVTYEQMLEALRKAVDERGADYRYGETWCTYVDAEGAPSCGVGVALVELGLREQMLAGIRSYQEDYASGSNIGYAAKYQPIASGLLGERMPEVDVDPEAVRLANYFQQSQDAGKPWGDALEYAIAHVAADRRVAGVPA